MTTPSCNPPVSPRWSWMRTASLSGAIIVHVVALLMLARPGEIPASLPLRADIAVTLTTEPPEPVAVALPPEPQPLKQPSKAPPPQRSANVVSHVAHAEPSPIAPSVTASINEADKPMGDPAATSTPTAIGGNVTLAYERIVDPRYPADAKRRREHGTVVLRVLVGVDGLPDEVRIERSSGSQRLDRAARDAVLQWRFRPVQVDGVHVPASGLVPVQFALENA